MISLKRLRKACCTERYSSRCASGSEAGATPSREREFSFAPRVRVEWLIAGTRVVLALGGLLAAIVDPLDLPVQAFVLYVLA